MVFVLEAVGLLLLLLSALWRMRIRGTCASFLMGGTGCGENWFLLWWAFPLLKNPPANAEDSGSIPGSGRSPVEKNGNLLQYSCLENPMDRGACWALVHRVAKNMNDLVSKTTTMMSFLLQDWLDNFFKSEIESKSHSVVSDSLRPHGLSIEFSRPEYWSG